MAKKTDKITEIKNYVLSNMTDKLKTIMLAEEVYLWRLNEKQERLECIIPIDKIGSNADMAAPAGLDQQTGRYIMPGGPGASILSSFQEKLSVTMQNTYIIKVDSGRKIWGYLQIINSADLGIAEVRDKEIGYLRTLIQNCIEDSGQTEYMKEKLLTLSNVKKTYHVGNVSTPVLKGISIDIYKGELIAILGASGSGKTTLLNLIGGMDTLTEGEFLFEDKDYSAASERMLTNYRRSNVGYIFQAYNLMPNLTVKENLDFIAALSKHPYDSREILRGVGMAEYEKNYPSQLSGGQQQRVSIARAVVKNPQIILADEPTAALDYKNSIEILKILQNLVIEGTTMVMVTHNEEISKMADRVVHIQDGVIISIAQNPHPCQAEVLRW